ncbi:hypothetical protein BDV3_004162 [Batrachochytrium dendrobatidis]
MQGLGSFFFDPLDQPMLKVVRYNSSTSITQTRSTSTSHNTGYVPNTSRQSDFFKPSISHKATAFPSSEIQCRVGSIGNPTFSEMDLTVSLQNTVGGKSEQRVTVSPAIALPSFNKLSVGKWQNGQNIHLGIEVSTTLAKASKITYPKSTLRSNRLPKISCESNTSKLNSVVGGLVSSKQKNQCLLNSSSLNSEVIHTDNSTAGITQDYFLLKGCPDTREPSRKLILESLKHAQPIVPAHTTCRLQPSRIADQLPCPNSTTIIKPLVLMADAQSSKIITLKHATLAVMENLSNSETITVNIGIPAHESHSTIRIHKEIVYQSATLKHIHLHSTHFQESVQGLSLPTIPTDVILQIMEYLTRQYYKQNLWKEGMVSVDEIQPRLDHLFDLMEAGMYLDLPGLVDLCAKLVAKNFDCIKSFEELSTMLVRSVLKHLNVGQLIICEHDLLARSKEESMKSVSETKTGNLISKPCINTQSIWINQFWRLMNGRMDRIQQCVSQHDHFTYQHIYNRGQHCDSLVSNLNNDTAESVMLDSVQSINIMQNLGMSLDDVCEEVEFYTVAKRVCLENYILDVLGQPLGHKMFTQVIQHQGSILKKLYLDIGLIQDNYGIQGLVGQLSAYCSNLKQLVLRIDRCNQYTLNELTNVAQILPNTCQLFLEVLVVASSSGSIPSILALCTSSATIEHELLSNKTNSFNSVFQPNDPHSRQMRIETESNLDLRGISSLAEFIYPSSWTNSNKLPATNSIQNRQSRHLGVHMKWIPTTSKQMGVDASIFHTFLVQIPLVHIRITHLDLSNIQLSPDTTPTIIALVSHAQSSLTHLVLTNTHLTASALATIFDAMQHASSNLTYISISRTIHSADPNITDCCKSIAAYIASNRTCIRTLDLSDNPLTSLGMIILTDAIATNTRLTCIHLNGVNLGSHVKHLVKSVTIEQTSLTKICIARNGVLPRGLCLVIDALQTATNQHNVPKQIHIQPLCTTTITYLDISANVFDQTVATRLAAWISSGTCQLNSLVAKGLGTPVQTLGTNGIIDIVASVHHALHLMHIDFSAQCLNDTVCEALGNAIAMRTCQKWVLTDNLLTDQGVGTIKRVIATTEKRLEQRITIDLQRNWISKKAATVIPSMIMHSSNVLIITGYQHSNTDPMK